MGTARVFRSGNSQAVRLPKQFRLKSEEVEIFRRGDACAVSEAAPGRSGALGHHVWRITLWGSQERASNSGAGAIARVGPFASGAAFSRNGGESYGVIRSELESKGEMIWEQRSLDRGVCTGRWVDPDH
jgi:hypothetical protein